MPVEQGATQRRSLGNDSNTLVGQAADAQPKSSSGESYFVASFGPGGLIEFGKTKYVGGLEPSISPLGNTQIESVASASRTQLQTRLLNDGVDFGTTARAGQKQPLHAELATSSPEKASQSTSQMNSSGYPPTPPVQVSVVYYKLIAFDSVTNAKIGPWVDTQVSLRGAPASTNPPTKLTVEAQWTQ